MAFRAVPVFVEVLRGTIDNLGAAFRMAWPWLLLLVPLQIAAILYQARQTASAHEDWGLGTSLVSIGCMLIAFLAGASIAVNWHRYLLLDEEAAERLRVDRPVWRYIGNGLLLMLPLFILMIVFVTPMTVIFGLAFLEDELATADVWLTVAILLGTLVPLAVLQRLSLKFPAVAIGRDDYGFRDSWRGTRGYFLRILGFTLLSTALSLPAAVLFSLWTPDMQSGFLVAFSMPCCTRHGDCSWPSSPSTR